RLYAPFEDTVLQQRRWKEKFARLMSIRKEIVATQENLHLALPGTIHHIVSYRGGSGGSSGSSKDKRAPRDPELDVTFGKHELFGDGRTEEEKEDAGALSAMSGSSGNSSPLGAAESSDEHESASGSHKAAATPKQPPPTPETQVQQDSVDPSELADAINTPISKDAVVEDGGGVDALGMHSPPATITAAASSEKFYPVWVQSVPENSFREIVLRSTLVTDHMPSAYELAFAHAIETQMHERRLLSRRSRKQPPPSSSSSEEASKPETSTNGGNKDS
ncbi:hypothetical protein EV175_005345, partial [Coemansia sp. RSA 1933]